MSDSSSTPPSQALLIGASWYPEMWPEDEWPKDIARMQELGFNAVRLFEFAWKRFEPSEGEYDFAWAVDLLDQLHRSGIGVIIGTPTAAPPAWLTARYPEVLQTKANGVRATHGQRKHYNQHSTRYRELSTGIVRAMAGALGQHPAVIGWQIDNEMSGHDYGEETQGAFHQWLENRYGTIEELNRQWGLAFWSQAYDSFAQIPMVTAAVGSIEVPERHHPSLLIAQARFQNDGWKTFIDLQVAAIREVSEAPVSTNMTGYFGAMDWSLLNRDLDVVGYSMYADVHHYHYNLPRFDRMRSMKKRPFWLLETAPNWSGGGRQWNIHHHAQGMRAFTWLSYFLGAELMLYWQWRSHWAGQEMLHGTHVTATGKWAPNKEAWTRLAAEGREWGEWLRAHPPAQAEIGLLTSYSASWAFSIDPFDVGMQYSERIRDDFHFSLLKQQYWRDILSLEEGDYAGYKLLLAPMLPMVSEDRVAALTAWVEAGGTLVLGPLTGYRTPEFTAFTDREFGPLTDLTGADTALGFTVQWVEEKCRIVFSEDFKVTSRNWCWSFQETPEVEVLARYEGGYGDGQAAIIRRRLGRGQVITLGGMLMENGYARFIQSLCNDLGILPLAEAAPRVMVIPRANAFGDIEGWGVVNLTSESQPLRLPGRAVDAFSGQVWEDSGTLDPLGVMLLRRSSS